MGTSGNYLSSRNFGFLSETRKMSGSTLLTAMSQSNGKKPAGVASGYVEDFLQNLTKSQPKSQNCSRKIVSRGALMQIFSCSACPLVSNSAKFIMFAKLFKKHRNWTIFDPHVYPMNWTWLTGKLTKEQLEERKEGVKFE